MKEKLPMEEFEKRKDPLSTQLDGINFRDQAPENKYRPSELDLSTFEANEDEEFVNQNDPEEKFKTPEGVVDNSILMPGDDGYEEMKENELVESTDNKEDEQPSVTLNGKDLLSYSEQELADLFYRDSFIPNNEPISELEIAQKPNKRIRKKTNIDQVQKILRSLEQTHGGPGALQRMYDQELAEIKEYEAQYNEKYEASEYIIENLERVKALQNILVRLKSKKAPRDNLKTMEIIDKEKLRNIKEEGYTVDHKQTG